MVHRACSSGWTLTRVTWTSSPIRNQRCTRIQLDFQFRASFGFEFEEDQSVRRAIIPNLPVDPSERSVEEEMNSRATRKRGNSSPALSTIPPKRKRCTQTDILGEHLNALPRKYNMSHIIF